MKNLNKIRSGKLSRAAGKRFEILVRDDLESKGWIVDRWTNNVEISDVSKEIQKQITEGVEKSGFEVCGEIKVNPGYIGKLVPAKVSWRRTNHGMFPMGLNSGFPDFIVFRPASGYVNVGTPEIKFPPLRILFEIIGVECKMTGKLDKEEKEKCKWLLENNIFSKILIASKTKVKNKVVIKYEEFKK